MRRRILLIGSFTGLGGAERCLRPIAQALQLNGWDVDLLLTREPVVTTFADDFPTRVLTPPLGESRTRWFVCTFWKLAGECDLIWCASEFTPTYIAWIISTLRRKPLVTQVQANLSRYFVQNGAGMLKLGAKMIYRAIPAIHSVSQGVTDDLSRNFGVKRERVRTISNPFDFDELFRLADKPIDATEVDLVRGAVVFVGRLEPQKRLDIAVQAFSGIRNESARLVIVGDGSLREAVHADIQKRGLEGRVSVLGYRDNPFPYIKRAAALLLTSEYEGFGRVLVEAMALGTPVISTDCPSGPREILGDNEYGLLAAVNDPDSIARAIDHLLDSSELAATFRTKGPQRAADFSSPALIPQYLAMIDDAMKLR